MLVSNIVGFATIDIKWVWTSNISIKYGSRVLLYFEP